LSPTSSHQPSFGLSGRRGKSVAGRRRRSCRWKARRTTKAPIGVAPSPSRLIVRRPDRPKAHGNLSPPMLAHPRVELMDSARIWSSLPAVWGGILQGSRGFTPDTVSSASPVIHSSQHPNIGERNRMSAARKILIVDDDEDLRETLRDQLALHDEFQVTTVADAASGMEAVKNSHFDLIILDVGLPDMDGREACKALRKSGFKAPIIMLTGNASDADTILGLDAGANDYVTKPFKFAVLLARIRAQLRQHEQSEDAVFTIGKYTFKPAAKLLIDEKGSKIRLTEKETSILKYLYRAGEKVVTRDVLLLEVWGYNANVTTHTLETHIYRLRQKIERDPSKAELLVTETGGYKLIP